MAKGSDERPAPPPPKHTHTLTSSALSCSASVWFPWCHQSLREESYYKPFTFTHTGCTATAACAHMGVCMSVRTEGKYGSMHEGETVSQ